MTASATLLQPGQSLTYGLVATNQGPSTVTGVTLTDTLPSGVVLLSTNSSRGSFTVTNGIVTYFFGVLTNGASETATIAVMAPNESVLNNVAKVASLEPELVPRDNTASTVTVVVSDASRTLRINPVPNSPVVVISWPNSPVFFTLHILDALSPTNLWLLPTNMTFIVGGRYTVTNDASGGNRFFRLQRP